MKETRPYGAGHGTATMVQPLPLAEAPPAGAPSGGASVSTAYTTANSGSAGPAGAVAGPLLASDGDLDVVESLPREHPAWQRDALSVSSRVRAALAAMRPVVVRVMTFWHHAVRSVRIGERNIEIDPSGCYRLR